MKLEVLGPHDYMVVFDDQRGRPLTKAKAQALVARVRGKKEARGIVRCERGGVLTATLRTSSLREGEFQVKIRCRPA